MATLLLVVIYIAFLGIGIPDSLFGAAWPAIYADFGVPLSMGNCITLVVACGTVTSSFFSARVINKLGTAKVVAISTTMTALGLLGYSVSPGLWAMVLCGIPLGLGAGSIDAALNNYVAMHYKVVHMNFLHCIGNVGTVLSPYLMSFALAASANWRSGCRTVLGVQAAIAVITILSLPLWKKIRWSDAGAEEEELPRTLSTKEVLALPSVKPWLLMLFCSCAVEFTCGLWGSTYLVESKKLGLDSAAVFAAIYYLGMTVGRLLSGLLSSKLSSWKLIVYGEIIMAAAMVMLVLPLPAMFSAVGLFLVGLGNGPVFPNMSHLTPHIFGREVSQSVMGLQISVSYVGIMLAPALFGVLAQQITTALFPWYILIFSAGLFLSTAMMKRK